MRMVFKKGYKMTEEHKRKIGEANKNRNVLFKDGHIPWNKDIPMKEEIKRKLSESLKGQIPWNKNKINVYSKEMIIKMSISQKKRFEKDTIWNKDLPKEMQPRFGKHWNLTEETKKKISKNNGTKKEGYIHPMLGKHHSKETIKKYKEKRKNWLLPKKDTSIEVKIQNFLKELGINFFTHQYIKEIEHSYQCDILIPSMNLVIECDGNYWHKYPIGREIDNIRTSELIKKGFKVLRLWEHEIKELDLSKFKERINFGIS